METTAWAEQEGGCGVQLYAGCPCASCGPWMPGKLARGGSRQTQEMSFLRGHQGKTIEESELYLPSLLWAGWGRAARNHLF